jgi:flagellar export protein FliJ
MSPRKKRLDKLIAHREHKVEEQLVKLAEARAKEQVARRIAEEKQRALDKARNERAELLTRPLAADHFVLTNDWMVSCAHVKELADRAVEMTVRGVAEAQKQLIFAKNELKKLELIAERMAREERVRLERGEQKLADEFAAQRVSGAEKRRGDA